MLTVEDAAASQLRHSMSGPGQAHNGGKGMESSCYFSGCYPCTHSHARKFKQQHSALGLGRAVSSQHDFLWSVRDFQDKRAQCNHKEAADARPRAVVSRRKRRQI